MILPLWADLYAYAALAESLEVGHWGCRETSPRWTQDCLRDSILHALNDESAAKNAKKLGEELRSREKGRDIAAREIAKLAQIGAWN